MGYILYLVTYDRGTYLNTGKSKPYHWSFFIQKEIKSAVNLGIAHQLRGMPGAFFYKGPEEMDLNESGPLKEELQIGEVDAAKLDLVHERLKECGIDAVESSGWNCQDWALEGLEKLRAEGFVDETYTQEVVRNWLKEK
ncbi:hypothetical protein GJ744_009729 [Endocarpon pusillum]|uniref:Uncharacterized protein n=1 Tax=Endocarpon pusillum TaxID=364733 RepID=A0A8H7AQ75_9EURO|nr:hypothetical protein GJ744_009729 [Endocarpon pusillum]